MKKIQAKASEKTLIADIYISDEDKNIIGYSCTMIAEEYMKKNHPDTKEWGCEMEIGTRHGRYPCIPQTNVWNLLIWNKENKNKE